MRFALADMRRPAGDARRLAPSDDQTQASALGKAQARSGAALSALRERARQRGIDLEEERRRSLGRQTGATEVRCMQRGARARERGCKFSRSARAATVTGRAATPQEEAGTRTVVAVDREQVWFPGLCTRLFGVTYVGAPVARRQLSLSWS